MVKVKDVEIMRKFIAAISVCVLLAGCQTTSGQGQQQSGKTAAALFGALAGGLLGSRMGKGKGRAAGAAVGALLGYVIANAIFDSLSASDKQAHNVTRLSALDNASPGEWREWKNPDTKSSGESKVKKEFGNKNNDPCKVLADTIHTPQGSEEIEETYCRNQATGNWELAEAGIEKNGGVWQPNS